MNIGVLGGGAIGLLVSSYLSSKHKITIYVKRNEQKRQLNELGLLSSQSKTPLSVKALLVGELKQEDCIIVCLKQPHLPEVIPVFNSLNIHTPIIFLQNGMGHIDYIKQINQPVLIGVVEHGALRERDYIVRHTGEGIIKLAPFNEKGNRVSPMVSTLDQSNFPIQMVDDWKPLLKEKLIVNAVINPLTALFGVTNGVLLTNPYIHTLAKGLCKETAMILNLDFSTQWNRIKSIAATTSENVSSMCKDIKERRQTEIDAISGYLIEQTTQDIPNTTFIYTSIKAMEREMEQTDKID